MPTFTQAIHTSRKAQKTTTENGMPSRVSTTDYCLDYFYNVGASRNNPQQALNLFQQAYSENPDLATRILLWSRDIREGAGERAHFRTVLRNLAVTNWGLAERLATRIAELGRWDDMLVLFDTPAEHKALELISTALTAGDSLAAKWTPREKSSKRREAYKIRKHMNLSPKAYRKLLSRLTNVVEQSMCAKQWSSINYSHVPSQASRIYSHAFLRNDESRYRDFLADAMNPESTAKINAGATYPYEVLGNVSSYYWNPSDTDHQRILAQWQNLPNFIPESARIMPIIDVSGSMGCPAGGSTTTCMDVAISLGLYIAEKQQGAFKDVFLTFSENPQLVHCTGNVIDKATTIRESDWGMTTNYEKAIEAIFRTAADNNVPPEEMPEHLLVFSDMQFSQSTRNPNFTASKLTKSIAKQYGYTIPKIVFWNLHATGDVPNKGTVSNVAMVSGFSPSLVKSLLADIESYTPINVMRNTVNIERYNY